MSEIKGLGFIILALIVGAAGLGLGAFTIISVQTGALNGDDGDDGDDGKDGINAVVDPTNVYYCSSETEIQNAIDTVGFGSGIIMVTDNILLAHQ